MNIAVLIKPVLDCGVTLVIDEDNMRVTQKDQEPKWIVNPADRCALEAALTLKRKLETTQICAVSYMPPERTEALYYAIARGVDRSIIIEDEAALSNDASFTAYALGAYLAHQDIGLVICGNRSMDSGMACMGPYIAEHLRMPYVTDVVALDLAPNRRSIAVRRRLEKGNREKIECKLPAVVAVDAMITHAPYVSTYALMAARKKDITRIKLAALGTAKDRPARTRRIRLDPPRPRPKKTFLPDSKLSAAERMRLIRSGGMTKKKDSETLTGSPQAIADGIFKFLQDKGFLR